MIDVEIRGFQSIEHLSIRIDGFTALVGRSNIGKSAVVRAIKCALTNTLGTSFVRHGVDCVRATRKAKTCRCQSSVHLKAEGFDLLWEKGDSINRYFFNGQQYDKPGHGIPEFLTDNGFAPVKIGEDVGSIQIADQFFPIFLLNQSGPAAAEAVSDVARLDRVLGATRLVEKDRREVVATRKVREKDAEELHKRLEAYDGLDPALAQAQGVAGQLGGVEKASNKLEALTSYVLRSSVLVERIRALWTVNSIEIADVGPVTKRREEVEQLGRFIEAKDRRVKNYKAVEWVEKFLEQVPAIEPTQEAGGTLRRLERWVLQLRQYRDRFKVLESAEALSLPSREDLEAAQGKLKDLSGLVVRFEMIAKAIRRAENDLEEVSKEEKVVQVEVEALGVCPTCTQPFTTEHLHA